MQRTLQLATSNKALAAEIEVRKAAEAARNDLQRRLDSAREDEQRRTARDLHDQVGQTLGALMLSIKAACEANALPSSALTRLEEALKLAEELGRDIHGIASRLRPAVFSPITRPSTPVAPQIALSEREAEVLRLSALGYAMKRIAADLQLSPRT